jgi:hypothetical protein
MDVISKVFFADGETSTFRRKRTTLSTVSTPRVTYIDAALCNVTCQTAMSMNLSFSSQCPSHCGVVITEKLQDETGSIGKKFLSSKSM